MGGGKYEIDLEPASEDMMDGAAVTGSNEGACCVWGLVLRVWAVDASVQIRSAVVKKKGRGFSSAGTLAFAIRLPQPC